MGLPVRLPPLRGTPIQIHVKSERDESGNIELRFGVRGRIDSIPVEAVSVAALQFVQAINADPPVVSLGAMTRRSGQQTAVVRLWYPRELGRPAGLALEVADPCIQVSMQDRPSETAPENRRNDRMNFAELSIGVDPAKAPDQLHAEVMVRTSVANVRIPVLGFIVSSDDGRRGQ